MYYKQTVVSNMLIIIFPLKLWFDLKWPERYG